MAVVAFTLNDDRNCITAYMHRYTHKPHLLSEVSRTAYRYGNARLRETYLLYYYLDIITTII